MGEIWIQSLKPCYTYLRLRQTSGMGSKETSDCFHTQRLHFQEWNSKGQRKTQTLRVNGP